MTPDLANLARRVRGRLQRLRPDGELLEIARALRGAEALEIGGPTPLFATRGRVPAYPEIASLDVVNFAATTIWDGLDWDGVTPRRAFVAEARHLRDVEDRSYDAVLASHVLEHTANPIGALREWHRVVRPGGVALIVLPHHAGTFDHRRRVTPIEHLEADAEQDMTEGDETHFEEILEAHDRRRDPGGDGPEAFERRLRANAVHRSMHHHVFDARAAALLLRAGGFSVERIAVRLPYHVVMLGRHHEPDSAAIDDERLEAAIAASPFAADRRSGAS